MTRRKFLKSTVCAGTGAVLTYSAAPVIAKQNQQNLIINGVSYSFGVDTFFVESTVVDYDNLIQRTVPVGHSLAGEEILYKTNAFIKFNGSVPFKLTKVDIEFYHNSAKAQKKVYLRGVVNNQTAVDGKTSIMMEVEEMHIKS